MGKSPSDAISLCVQWRKERGKEGREVERDNGEFIQHMEMCTHT